MSKKWHKSRQLYMIQPSKKEGPSKSLILTEIEFEISLSKEVRKKYFAGFFDSYQSLMFILKECRFKE